MERESAHTLLTGYLKGEEQANVSITFNVTSKLGSASRLSKHVHVGASVIIVLQYHYYSTANSDFSLETNRIEVRPRGDSSVVEVTFLTDGGTQEGNESLTLHLNPTPSTLLIIPAGEAVFFRNAINLTIVDANGECGLI
jgi:hypothetical protein